MLVRSFAGKPDQVALARNEVREYLDGMPGTDDVLAIVSALASNAVRHSRSRTGRFVVCVQVYQSYVFVEVIDEAGSWSAPDLDQGPDDHPRGLEIVTRLSRDWGVDPVQDGHRAVWAKVPVKAARGAASFESRSYASQQSRPDYGARHVLNGGYRVSNSKEPDSGPPTEPMDPVTGDGSLEEHHEDHREGGQLQLPLAIPVPVLNPQLLPGRNGLTP